MFNKFKIYENYRKRKFTSNKDLKKQDFLREEIFFQRYLNRYYLMFLASVTISPFNLYSSFILFAKFHQIFPTFTKKFSKPDINIK